MFLSIYCWSMQSRVLWEYRHQRSFSLLILLALSAKWTRLRTSIVGSMEWNSRFWIRLCSVPAWLWSEFLLHERRWNNSNTHFDGKWSSFLCQCDFIQTWLQWLFSTLCRNLWADGLTVVQGDSWPQFGRPLENILPDLSKCRGLSRNTGRWQMHFLLHWR